MQVQEKRKEMTTEPQEFIDIDGRAGTVTEAVLTRHSIRRFADREVPRELLRELFSQALRAPSWKNSQPWQVHVLTGASRDRMSARLVEAARSGEPHPDTAWAASFPADVKRRMFDLGMRIYGVAGIDRKDKNARDEFMLDNFRFFGAPVAVFLTTQQEMSFYTALDLGCFLNTILLLAREQGLGSCPQAALSAFPDVVREELQLPQDHKVACGISLGYAQADAALNRFHTPRENLEKVVRFL